MERRYESHAIHCFSEIDMYGIRIRNANRQILISDATYNFVFTGKASLAEWHTEYWSHGIINIGPEYGKPYNTILGQSIFFFDAPSDAPIFPMFYCTGFCGIMSIVRVSGNRWRIDCYAQSPPELYIFQKVPPTYDTGGGKGIAIKNQYSRTIAYCSNFPHMFPKAVENIYNGPSNIYRERVGSAHYWMVANMTEYSTAMDLSGVSKPIVGFNSGNNAARWDNSQSPYTWFFGLAAKVSGNSLKSKWCIYWQGYAKQYHDAPETNTACVVADARYFD